MNRKITAPRKTSIKGQPHQLAYINDFEEGLLLALGGAGKPVNGIPAYYDEGDDYTGQGGDDSSNDFGLSDDYGGSDADEIGNALADAAAAVAAANANMDKATEKDYDSRNPSAQDIEAARGFDFNGAASDALAASFGQGFNQMGAGLGYNVSGLELDKAFGQLPARMANAKAGYGLPGLFAGL